MRRLTSADLFSGAGGLTEGFHQQGFEVLASVDNWAPAAETHWRNFPETEMLHADILELDPSELPAVDVLIGSPPCTEFSYSNRGGHGDLNLGMRFVLRFLRFVHDIKPRYWAMENVPRLAQTLPSRVPLRRLGLQEDGFFEVPIRTVLNSADYGAPQRRLRLFSGHFPVPEPTHYGGGALDTFAGSLPWITIQDVLDALPDPISRESAPPSLTDPNYGFKLPVEELSDHFMDTVLTPEEVQINRKSKVDHSWYGRMAFPDSKSKPARTVMATQTGVSRETLVLEWERNGKRVYRRPTIRECATFQSFPLTYQFWGRTAETRYKLIGNAVPPVLAAAVAKSITSKEGLPGVGESPILARRTHFAPPPVAIARRRGGFNIRRFPIERKFRDHLPGSRGNGFRVDIDNIYAPVATGTAPRQPLQLPHHVRVWTARLFIGSGKHLSSVDPTFEQAVDLLAACSITTDQRIRAERLASELETRVGAQLPDATTLQAAWAGKIARRDFAPQKLLWRLAEIVDEQYPPEMFDRVVGPISPAFPRTGRTEMPVRTAAFLLAARFATEVVNMRVPGSSMGVAARERFRARAGVEFGRNGRSAAIPRAGQMVTTALSVYSTLRSGRHAASLDMTR